MSECETTPRGVDPKEYRQVRAALHGDLEPSTQEKSLRGSNAHLRGSSPLAHLRSGNLGAVLDAIRAEQSGSYA